MRCFLVLLLGCYFFMSWCSDVWNVNGNLFVLIGHKWYPDSDSVTSGDVKHPGGDGLPGGSQACWSLCSNHMDNSQVTSHRHNEQIHQWLMLLKVCKNKLEIRPSSEKHKPRHFNTQCSNTDSLLLILIRGKMRI